MADLHTTAAPASEVEGQTQHATSSTDVTKQVDLLSSRAFSNAQVVCFGFLFVCGLLGNGLLLGLNAWRRSKKQAVTQIFMCALSLSDVGLLLSDTWIKVLLASNGNQWTLGSFVCKLNSFWKTYSADSSVMTLAIISIDRFMGLNKPGAGFFSVRAATISIGAVWLTAAAINAPLLAWFDVAASPPQAPRWCTVLGPSQATFAGYTLVTRLVAFFAPLAVTWTCYVGVWYRMASASVKSDNNQASRRVAVMCFTVVTVFTVAWTPFEGVLMYYAVFAYGADKQRAVAIMQPLLILANCNLLANPVIYGFMWKPMQKAFTQVFCRRCAKAAVRPAHGQQDPSGVTGISVLETTTVHTTQSRM